MSDSDLQELVRGTATGFVLRAAALLLGVLVQLTIARLYGSTILGLYSLALVCAYTVAMVGRLGTDRAIVRFIASQNPPGTAAGTILRRIVAVTLPLSAILALALYFTSEPLALHVFEDPEVAGHLRALALGIPAFNLLCAFAAGFQGSRQIAFWALSGEVIPNLLTLAILLTLTWSAGPDQLLPAISRALAFAAAAGAAALLWRRRSQPTPGVSAAAPTTAAILRVARPMLVTASSYWILGWADIIMLGMMEEPAQVGIYRVAGSMAIAVSFVRPAVLGIAAPKLAEAWGRNEAERLSRIARLTARAGFGASVLIAVPVLILATPLLRLFGPEFVEGRLCLVVLCLSQLVVATCGASGQVLDMIGEERALRTAVLIAAGLNLMLNLIWIPRWGILGAAAATLCSTAVWNGLAAARASRKLGRWVGIG